MINTIIIDDEDNAIQTLKELIKINCPSVSVVAQAYGIEEGLELINRIKPDVVLLDISMQDGSGFDLLDRIKDPFFQVIFTTAYDEYALKAFRYCALDYLLKPVDPDELILAFQKAENQLQNRSSQEKIASLLKFFKEDQPDQIALTTNEGLTILKLRDILRLESSGSYTTFYTLDNKKITVTKTLKDFHEILPTSDFIRIHQSHIINLNCIKMVLKEDGGQVLMNNCEKIPISRRKKEVIIDALYRSSLS